MKRKDKEASYGLRILNFFLGLTILLLFFLRLFVNEGRTVFEIVIFALAAIENFVGATLSLSVHNWIRGNIYAIVSVLFLIMAAVLAAGYF